MTLFFAMLLDAALGEPRWLWSRLPHPAVLMGRAVGWLDATFNEGRNLRRKGTLSLIALVTGAGALGWLLQALPGPWIDIVVLAILLAQRSLADHVRAVARALERGLPEARRAVARIVGRDTAPMQAPDIARAAIESAAENLSDGVIAPIFWFVLAGLPGLLIYKAVNTADSMIGYRTPRHERFGWAAARLDDALNWLPARLTAGLIVLATRGWPYWRDIAEDAPAHRSPNAGWPEAAMAYGLNIALSGPRHYHGEAHDLPWVNGDGIRDHGPRHIYEAVRVLWTVWALVLIPAGLAFWLF